MYTLLAICLVLHPMRIDESVHSHLREKYADKQLRMQKRSATVYFGLYFFLSGCLSMLCWESLNC